MEKIKSLKVLENKLKDNIYNVIFKSRLEEVWDYYNNLEYYHVLTKELAEKMEELRFLDNVADSIGRYAYIANFGEPMPLDYIMGLEFDERTKYSETLHDANYVIHFETLAGYENLIKWGHFSELLENGGINHSAVDDIVIYTILSELEKSNKLHIN